MYKIPFAVLTFLAMSGCSAEQASLLPSTVVMAATPSPRADASYSFLLMEQGMRKDDMGTVLSAANQLLLLDPASVPLSEAASWLLSNGHISEGKDLLLRSVKALPDDLQLHILLSEAMLLQDENADNAIALLVDFARRHPEENVVNLELGLTFLKAEKPKEALEYFWRISSSERTPMVYYYAAHAHKLLGNIDAARQNLNKALKLAPDFLEALLEAASLEEEQKNYKSALVFYEKLYDADSENQDLKLRLVVLYARTKNFSKAMKIISASSDPMTLTVNASAGFLEEGKPEFAKKLLDTFAASSDAPNDVAFYQAALLYETKKDANGALKYLAQVPKESSLRNKSLQVKVQVLVDSGKSEDALVTVLQGRSEFPTDVTFITLHYKILSFMGRYAEAIPVIKEMLQLNPDDFDLRFSLGLAYELVGSPALAMSSMESLLKDFPNRAEVLNFVGYSLADQNKDLERAEALVRRAMEILPNTDYIMDSWAWVQYRRGRTSDAWQAIQKAVELAGDKGQDSVMWDHYGDIANAQGLSDEAKSAWEKSLKLKDDGVVRAKLESL